MFAILTENDQGEWDYYPDPLYNSREEAQKKVDYLVEYRIKHKMTDRSLAIRELDNKGQEQHKREWHKWCSVID